jgi:small basic protein (TIGR04137 family)
MSIDKSLRRKSSLQRARSVLTRGERIKTLQDEERWKEDQSPFGLPKVRVHKVVIKKAKKAKEEAKPEGEAAAAGAAAAPAAAGAEAGKAPAKGAAPPKKEEKKK